MSDDRRRAGDDQLDRIEAELRRQSRAWESIDDRFRVLNGQVARNTQTLRGVDGRGGLVDEVSSIAALVERLRSTYLPAGTVSTKTVFAIAGLLLTLAGIGASVLIPIGLS